MKRFICLGLHCLVAGGNETEHYYGAGLVETDPNATLHYFWIKWNWDEPKV